MLRTVRVVLNIFYIAKLLNHTMAPTLITIDLWQAYLIDNDWLLLAEGVV